MNLETLHRQKIADLESAIIAAGHCEIPVRHYHALGLYAREIFIPKGATVTAKIHKFEHMDIVSMGDITTVTEHGLVRIKAPHTQVTPPGIKRAAYAHEDTIWTTILANPIEERDIEALEDYFVVGTHEEYLEWHRKLLGGH